MLARTSNMNAGNNMNIGSTVRARRRIRRLNVTSSDGGGIITMNGTQQVQRDLEVTQRAVIATIEQNDDRNDHQVTTACLIWESLVPQPISTDVLFAIAPNAGSMDGNLNMYICNDEGEETEVPIELLLPLYPFEITPPPLFTDQSVNISLLSIIQLWKDCGDVLYQIHDVVGAIPYYEYALYLSCNCNKYQVGTTIFMKDSKGYIVAAEIDCIDTDDNDDLNFDVTIIETGEERTIRRKDITLSQFQAQNKYNSSSNSSKDIQIRILLNLSRCLLQYVELIDCASGKNDSTSDDGNILVLKETYCKRVVLATSIALTIVKLLQQLEEEHRENAACDVNDSTSSNNTLLKLETSALLLRGKAQYQLKNKLKHAMMDLQRISSSSKEAQQLLRQIHLQQKHIAKTNQRLAKNVNKWIQTTLNSTDHHMDSNDDDGNVTGNNKHM